MTKPDQRPPRPEPFIDAITLEARMRELGIVQHYDYWRAGIRACPYSIRGKRVRFSDFWSWWLLNPGWRPFGRDSWAGAKVGKTPGLSVNIDATALPRAH